MDNAPVRPEFAAVLDARRDELRRQLVPILADRPDFVWEIGCGHGHFLTAYGASHPERVCIGIDLVGERIERARRKRDRANLSRVHFLRAEARLFLATLPAPAVIADLYVLFPDPWPKLRHHKHRILQPEFLAAAAARAAPGCRLCFRTDHAEYFAATRAVIRESPHWEEADLAWPFEFETVFQHRAPRYESLVARRRQPA